MSLSSQSAVTVYSPYDGVVKELVVGEEETAHLEKPLVVFEVEDGATGAEEHELKQSPPPPAESAAAETTPSTQPPVSSGKVLATPAVRHLAAEKGVNLADVVPTGKGGRLVKEDILNYITSNTGPTVSGPVTPPPSAEDRVESITGFKLVMVRTMTESGRIPQFGYKDEVDMNELVELRSLLKTRLSEGGVAFSYMPVLIKAVSLALVHHPVLNSTVDPDCTTITYRADHNVGVAMDTPLGLIVPNVKRVQEKSVYEIAVELNRLQSLGAAGQLPPADTADGTFSLSNIGAIGGTYANPMLLPPSVAIGAFGRVKVVPRFDSEGDLERGHVMHVSWAADHRVIDGAEVARFSNHWKSYVENPASMILDMK
jgi:2-oxoisovalerate dehydrogenase E2 component (dihydrolipoyl transacylase)